MPPTSSQGATCGAGCGAGAAIGSLLGAALIVVVCFYIWQRFRARAPSSLTEADAQAHPELEMRTPEETGAGATAMGSVAPDLMMLQTALDKGLLTQEEYDKKRIDLLLQL